MKTVPNFVQISIGLVWFATFNLANNARLEYRLKVIINPTTVWSFLFRHRFGRAY
jgi:hypothetical protein